MNEKVVGYVLLLSGIIVMFGALIEVLLVFTGKTDPLPVIAIQAPKLSLDAFIPKLPSNALSGSLPSSNQSLELIPTKEFNKIINMSVTLFLMGFLLSFGYKIASLGVMMLRPISIKVAGKPDASPPQPL
ncbi:MAG: hypothetical protein Q8Q49_06320 [bacterium]|nr:hypothetical protein [bacterium]